jgi:hypothetical protein
MITNKFLGINKMKSTVAIVVSVLAVIAAIMLVNSRQQQIQKEGFTADGWVLNQPPEWFHKPTYDPNDWIVAYYPDQLAKPGGCDMHYRGDPRELNFLSSAYRFWRM